MKSLLSLLFGASLFIGGCFSFKLGRHYQATLDNQEFEKWQNLVYTNQTQVEQKYFRLLLTSELRCEFYKIVAESYARRLDEMQRGNYPPSIRKSPERL